MNTVPTTNHISALEVIAKTASQTTFFRSYSPQEIFTLFLVAEDLGLPRSVVLSKGINLIQGSVELSARVMNMLIRKHGHSLKVLALNDGKCTIWGKRKDTGEEHTVSYTIEDARKANLMKAGGAWFKNPSDMCFARAISRLARQLFPDAIGNCYIEGEIAERASKEVLEDAPDMKELQIEKAPELHLEIPSDIDGDLVDKYFNQLEETFEKPRAEWYQRAANSPEKFWENFRNWEAAQLVSS